MDYQLIEKRIEEYVTGLYKQMQSPDLVFHNLDHTRNVVKHALEIAAHYNIKDKEMLVLVAAAWFYDIGYLYAKADEHEEMSSRIMKRFMKDYTEGESILDEINAVAMAAKFPGNPKTLLEEILCDADTYHFGTKQFKQTNKKIHEELKLRNGKMDPVKFKKETIQLLKTHVYYTSYCKDLLNEGKQENINRLEKKSEKKEDQKEEHKAIETGTLSDLQKDKSDLMGKGIQTMLRLTSANHLKLSEMADRKANILISVNSIIISVLLIHKLTAESNLVIPTVIFVTSAITVIVISILATRPKISGGSFLMSEVKEKKTNLLFFGNFYKATYEEYNEAMGEMMLDTNYLYNILIKDIHSLGVVLGRKYKLIRLAYNVFMIGIIVSVLAFGISAIYAHE